MLLDPLFLFSLAFNNVFFRTVICLKSVQLPSFRRLQGLRENNLIWRGSIHGVCQVVFHLSFPQVSSLEGETHRNRNQFSFRQVFNLSFRKVFRLEGKNLQKQKLVFVSLGFQISFRKNFRLVGKNLSKQKRVFVLGRAKLFETDTLFSSEFA